MEFKIYHLGQPTTDSDKIKQAQLRKPHRKLDETVIQGYVLSKIDELAIRERPIKTHEQYLQEKCKLAKEMIAEGSFDFVAEVKFCRTPYDAIVKTNSINKRWFLVKDKGVTVHGTPNRDTTSYDIVEWEDKQYLYTTFGLIDIEECKYFSVK